MTRCRRRPPGGAPLGDVKKNENGPRKEGEDVVTSMARRLVRSHPRAARAPRALGGSFHVRLLHARGNKRKPARTFPHGYDAGARACCFTDEANVRSFSLHVRREGWSAR